MNQSAVLWLSHSEIVGVLGSKQLSHTKSKQLLG
jgi:hypothetical protein